MNNKKMAISKQQAKKNKVNKKTKNPKKKLKPVKKIRKVPKKRDIIKNPITPWIYFCKEMSPSLPSKEFGPNRKILSKMWRKMDDIQKEKYIELGRKDKIRFLNDCKNLTEQNKKDLRYHRSKQKRSRKCGPQRDISAYMIFVKENHKRIRSQYPDKEFKVWGKIMGDDWHGLTDAERKPFDEKAANDKKRYLSEMVLYKSFLINNKVSGKNGEKETELLWKAFKEYQLTQHGDDSTILSSWEASLTDSHMNVEM